MNILTIENTVYNLNNLPDSMEDVLRFSILDNSDNLDPDFFFIPLIFLESFTSPGMVISIGSYQITIPIDWSILIGCKDSGSNLEAVPLTSINNRGFDAFVFNPVSSFKFEFLPIQVEAVYNDMKWYFPRIKQNQLLTTPLSKTNDPKCAFFIKDVSKQGELIDQGLLL